VTFKGLATARILWSLFLVFQTFEGHDASVLKIIFVSRGTQLLSG